MFFKLRITLLLCLLSLLASAAHAATLNVGPGQPYTTIQSAIDAAATGDTVRVAAGTYYEQIDFKGKAITVVSAAGAATTIIDAQRRGPAVTFATMEPRTAILDGFTVVNGAPISGMGNVGGGIYISNSAPTVRNNDVSDTEFQAGIGCYQAAPLLQSNHVHGNYGNIYLEGYYSQFPQQLQYAVITGNLVENSADYSGIMLQGPGDVTVTSNIIRNNYARLQLGGGILLASPGNNATVTQNLVYNNRAYSTGGGLYLYANGAGTTGHISVVNNTLANNDIYPQSGLIAATQVTIEGNRGLVTASNNIILAASQEPAIACEDQGAASVTALGSDHNLVLNTAGPRYGGTCADPTGSSGNLSAQPLFQDIALGDFHLATGSPAIDAGNNSALTLPARDLDGNPRVLDATAKGCPIVDLGVYEHAGVVDAGCISESLLSSLNPAAISQPVTFTANLTAATGVPTGTVQFLDGSLALSVQPVSSAGFSTYTTSALTAGSHAITAAYQPTGAFTATSASLTQIVTQPSTTTTLSCNPNPISINANALFLASVTASNGTAPMGTVAFTDNGTPLGQPALVNGNASLLYIGSAAGSHTIVATTFPVGGYSGSSATCTEVVNLRPTTLALATSQNPSNVAQPVTFTATATYQSQGVNLAGAGSVTFSDGTTPLQTVTVGANLTATYTTSALAAGTHAITATLNPPTNFSPSSASLSQVITGVPSIATLTASPLSLPSGATLNFTITVTAASPPGPTEPLGRVTFFVDGRQYGNMTDLPQTFGGIRHLAGFFPFPVGTHQLTCNYGGDATYLPAICNALTITVTPSPTTTTLTAAPNPAFQNQPVTLTALVNNAAGLVGTGPVTFFDGTQPIGTGPLLANRATLTTTQLAPGSHTLTAAYAGDSATSASVSPGVTETILQFDFTFTATPGSLTLSTGHHTTFILTGASTGNFAGQLGLSVDRLPAHATLNLSQTSLTLAQGGQATTSVYLDTDDVIGYLSTVRSPVQTPAHSVPAALVALLFVPLAVFTGKRRRLPALLFLALSAVLLASATGCSGKYPASVGPGNYTLRITATSLQTGIAHTAEVPLHITE